MANKSQGLDVRQPRLNLLVILRVRAVDDDISMPASLTDFDPWSSLNSLHKLQFTELYPKISQSCVDLFMSVWPSNNSKHVCYVWCFIEPCKGSHTVGEHTAVIAGRRQYARTVLNLRSVLLFKIIIAINCKCEVVWLVLEPFPLGGSVIIASCSLCWPREPFGPRIWVKYFSMWRGNEDEWFLYIYSYPDTLQDSPLTDWRASIETSLWETQKDVSLIVGWWRVLTWRRPGKKQVRWSDNHFRLYPTSPLPSSLPVSQDYWASNTASPYWRNVSNCNVSLSGTDRRSIIGSYACVGTIGRICRKILEI